MGHCIPIENWSPTLPKPEISVPVVDGKPDDTHFLRAYYSVPPYAKLQGYEQFPDHLKVTYAVAGARKPITNRVPL